MKKIRQFLKILVVISLLVYGYLNSSEFFISQNNIYDNLSQLKLNIDENINSSIEVEFCPNINCKNLFLSSILSAKYEIKCAIFDLGDIDISNELLKKSKSGILISLIIDDKYLFEKALINLKNTSIKIYSDINRRTKYNNYMHNKYCVIDKKILITGSTNPTYNGFYNNNNNILKINSKYLAKNYLNEFNLMSANVFGENKKSILEYNKINLIFENSTYKISSYFCPENNCEKEILKILNKSNFEILFASFVLTSNNIENLLIEKSKIGINVTGIVERKNRHSKGSRISDLNKYFKIYLDKNKNNMHHKFFIIDERYIITGSMNPSKSGNKYNDENILIIENSKLALKYKTEFLKLINS